MGPFFHLGVRAIHTFFVIFFKFNYSHSVRYNTYMHMQPRVNLDECLLLDRISFSSLPIFCVRQQGFGGFSNSLMVNNLLSQDFGVIVCWLRYANYLGTCTLLRLYRLSQVIAIGYILVAFPLERSFLLHDMSLCIFGSEPLLSFFIHAPSRYMIRLVDTLARRS